MTISFGGDRIVIMGAEEGQDEPVDAEAGIVTKNDFETGNLGLWRDAGEGDWNSAHNDIAQARAFAVLWRNMLKVCFPRAASS